MSRELGPILLVAALLGSLGVADPLHGQIERRRQAAFPDCSGLQLDGGCRTTGSARYRFQGSCTAAGEQVSVEATGEWMAATRMATEDFEVTGKGALRVVAYCEDDPWATAITCTVQVFSNASGLPFLAPESGPQHYPFTRRLVTAQQAQAQPVCGSVPKLPRKMVIREVPTVVSPDEGQRFRYGVDSVLRSHRRRAARRRCTPSSCSATTGWSGAGPRIGTSLPTPR